MQTNLVDVHVKQLRAVGYSNLKDWCGTEDNIYIGRGGILFIEGKRYPPVSSKWCNPFTTKKYGSEVCLQLYEDHLTELLEDDSNVAEFLNLRGKTLGCWCTPAKCHGDIIIRKLEELSRTGEEKK